jgi:hypothetical protein
MKNFLVRGPSNSQKNIDCQVPKTMRPFSIMTSSDAPTMEYPKKLQFVYVYL